MHYAPVPTYQSQEEDESDLGSTSTETSSDSGNEPIDMSDLTSLPQDQAAEVAFSNTVAPEDAGEDLQENQLDISVVQSNILNDAYRTQEAIDPVNMADDVRTIAIST